MRLLTHNYLQSNVKGTTKGYPLRIKPTKIVWEESPVNLLMVKQILPKIKYEILYRAVLDIQGYCTSSNNQQTTTTTTKEGEGDGSKGDSGEGAAEAAEIVVEPPPSLPEQLPDDDEILENDEELLTKLYKVLFDLHVEEGCLICPDTGREFQIKQGIPNMILHEDEI